MPHRRPLLLMTRPKASSERFVADLRAADAPRFDAVLSPLIETVTKGPLPDMDAVAGVIFTSAAGVRAYDQLGGAPLDPCFTVGDRTAQAARHMGFEPQSAQGDAEALVQMIGGVKPPTPLLHLRGTYTRGDVAKRLTQMGLPCNEAILYDQPACPMTPVAASLLSGEDPVIVPLFSPRTADVFVQSVPTNPNLNVIAISPAVAEVLSGMTMASLTIAEAPTGDHMRHAVLRHLAAASPLEGRNSQG